MPTDRRPAFRVFPPGVFIKDELEARGWTQADLAEIMGRPLQAINAIVNAKKAVTPETAVQLAAAFGTSTEIWMNMETAYRLSLAGPPDEAIAERARRHEAAGKAPAQGPRKAKAGAAARSKRRQGKDPQAV